MARSGQDGFSVLELLIVMMILGILAAVAVAKYRDARDNAIHSTLKSDLRNLAMRQESYFTDGNYTYTDDLAALEFTPSPDVTITFDEATNTGWSAQATHRGSAWRCALFMGEVPPLPPATTPGVVACTKP